MLFSKRQIPQWSDSLQRHLPHQDSKGPLSGHYFPLCSHQEHFDQQVHHQCSDQRCDTLSRHRTSGLGLFQGLPRAMWTVAGLVVVLLLLLSAHGQHGHGVSALSCAPCDPDLCPDTEDCRGGVVTDICSCCQVCAKMENESCGGSFGFLGECDRNLHCFIQPQMGQPITGFEAGICKAIPELKCNRTDCPNVYRYRFCPPDSYLQTIRTNNDTIASNSSSITTTTTTTTTTTQSPNSNGTAEKPLEGDGDQHQHHRSVEKIGQTSFCVCNTSTCQVPICPAGHVLHLQTNATGVPGDCCNGYTCETAHVCDPIICPPMDETPCPPDSVRLSNIWTPDRCCEIQQECACPAADLCPPVQCPAGLQIQVLERASGKPGSCCDRFRCVNESDLTCTYDGRERKNGDRWKIGRCRTCVCHDGINRCKDKVCPEFSCTWMDTPPGECCPVCRGCVSDSGRLYDNSAVWKENECTTCSCVDGHAQCQAEMCAAHCSNPKRVPGQCCPVCPDKEQETAGPVCPSPEPCSWPCSLEVSADGCPRCQCRKDKCALVCPFGYKSDVEGNPRCECRPNPERCPSLVEQGCNKKCEYGYKVSSEGCVKCKCNKCPSLKCTKRCVHGLMLNDEGCPICKCKDVAEPVQPKFKKKPEEIEGRSCMSQSGVHHDNGESWDDRCRVCYCHNGKEMCSVIACPAPQCPNPVFRVGDCCPSCPGVMLSSPNGEKQLCQAHDGQLYVEGQTWKMDACTLCVCHGGNILCETPSCPPLLCHHPVKHESQCCATCKGNDLNLLPQSNLRRRCKLTTGMVYRHGAIWRSTPCQSCICQDGQFHCYNQLCPVLTCAKTVLRKNQCCPTCVDTAKPKICFYEDESYNSDESWRAKDNCTECTCSSGKTICHPPSCPSLECSVMVKRKGECCPECYDYSNFHSTAPTSSSESEDKAEVQKNHNSSHRGFVIGLSIPLAVLFVLVILLALLLLHQRRKRNQFPFHDRNGSALDGHQGSIPFLQSHTKPVPTDNPFLEKLCPELSSDRLKSDRVTNNYTEIVFGDTNKETVANGHYAA